MNRTTTLLILFPAIASCATPKQLDLDEEVRRRCAADGGIKVYQTAPPPAGRRDLNGNVTVPAKAYATPKDEYYFESETTYYQKGNPEMFRLEYRVVRAVDKVVMGVLVMYTRRGGDFPMGPMHDSYFSCPEKASLEQSIFVKGN